MTTPLLSRLDESELEAVLAHAQPTSRTAYAAMMDVCSVLSRVSWCSPLCSASAT